MKKYNVGDTVTYRAISGERRVVKVDYKDDDIKDGRPGFEGTMSDGETVWGYDADILSISKGGK